jgi:hypothetical protein
MAPAARLLLLQQHWSDKAALKQTVTRRAKAVVTVEINDIQAWHKACNPLSPSCDTPRGASCQIIQECPLFSSFASLGYVLRRESP